MAQWMLHSMGTCKQTLPFPFKRNHLLKMDWTLLQNCKTRWIIRRRPRVKIKITKPFRDRPSRISWNPKTKLHCYDKTPFTRIRIQIWPQIRTSFKDIVCHNRFKSHLVRLLRNKYEPRKTHWNHWVICQIKDKMWRKTKKIDLHWTYSFWNL